MKVPSAQNRIDMISCKDKMPSGNAMNALELSNIHDIRSCIVENMNSMPIVRLKAFSFFKAKPKTLLPFIITAPTTHLCKPQTLPSYTR